MSLHVITLGSLNVKFHVFMSRESVKNISTMFSWDTSRAGKAKALVGLLAFGYSYLSTDANFKDGNTSVWIHVMSLISRDFMSANQPSGESDLCLRYQDVGKELSLICCALTGCSTFYIWNSISATDFLKLSFGSFYEGLVLWVILFLFWVSNDWLRHSRHELSLLNCFGDAHDELIRTTDWDTSGGVFEGFLTFPVVLESVSMHSLVWKCCC